MFQPYSQHRLVFDILLTEVVLLYPVVERLRLCPPVFLDGEAAASGCPAYFATDADIYVENTLVQIVEATV